MAAILSERHYHGIRHPWRLWSALLAERARSTFLNSPSASGFTSACVIRTIVDAIAMYAGSICSSRNTLWSRSAWLNESNELRKLRTSVACCSHERARGLTPRQCAVRPSLEKTERRTIVSTSSWFIYPARSIRFRLNPRSSHIALALCDRVKASINTYQVVANGAAQVALLHIKKTI